MVPQEMQPGFLFHGKEVFSGGRTVNREVWSAPDRLAFFKEVVSLPRKNQIPIGVGIFFNGAWDDLPDDGNKPVWDDLAVSKCPFEHGLAFAKCIERSDLFLRKYLDGNEMCNIIAEDVPEREKFVQHMGLHYRRFPLSLPPECLRPNKQQRTLQTKPDSAEQTIENIIDAPLFVNKHCAPLL